MMQAQSGRETAVDPAGLRRQPTRAASAPTWLRLLWLALLVALMALFAVGVPASYRLLSSGTLGVLVEMDPQGQALLEPIPERPAESAGVRAGDVLLAVNGEPVALGGLAEIMTTLREAVGTSLTLTVGREGGQAVDISIERSHLGAESLGISPRTYALILVVLGVLFVAAYALPAGVIALRRPDNWVAALVWLTLVLIAMFNSRANADMRFSDNWAGLAVEVAYHLAVLVVLLVFPDGRLKPRWTRWYLLVGVLWIVVKLAPVPAAQALTASPFWVLIDFLVFGIAVAAQVHRFRQSSDPAARQQTKWLVYAFVTAFLVQYAYYIPREFVAAFQGRSVYEFVGSVLNHVLMLVVPLAFTQAVMRHRLYDIDLIINRTLVYAPLTAILAGVFTASVTLLRGLFDNMIGGSSDAATILSSVIVVALLTPVRSRLQKTVDAHFAYLSRADRALKDLETQVTSRLQVVDAGPVIRRLLEHAVRGFDAVGGAAELVAGEKTRALCTSGEWTGEVALDVPVQAGARTFGRVKLAARRRGLGYSEADVDRLRAAATIVATAIAEDSEVE